MKELLHWATLFLWVGGWVGDLNQDERYSRMGHDWGMNQDERDERMGQDLGVSQD